MDLNAEQPGRIIALHRDANMGQREIQRKTGFALTTINRTIKNCNERGSTSSIKVGRCGRK